MDKLGPFAYTFATFDDNEAVILGPYELENNSVYVGQWKNGLRHGRGK